MAEYGVCFPQSFKGEARLPIPFLLRFIPLTFHSSYVSYATSFSSKLPRLNTNCPKRAIATPRLCTQFDTRLRTR